MQSCKPSIFFFFTKKTFHWFASAAILVMMQQLPFATTIIPFPNLGEMAMASDAVVVARAIGNYELQKGNATKFRTRFEITGAVKGSFVRGEPFELQAWHERVGDMEQAIWGDPEFAEGRKYLLFLARTGSDPFWQPMMLAYGIFEEENINGETLFVPSKESREIEAFPRPDGVVPEPMAVYRASELLGYLSDFIEGGGTSWEGKNAMAENSDAFLEERAAPAHCTFLTSTNPFRYNVFPGSSISIYSEDNGDTGYSPPSIVHGLVSSAVTTMGTEYAGINVIYGGTRNHTPDCAGGTAQGGNFCTGTGFLEGLVMYDDPCSQITDLSGCSGTLAVGGLYSSGTHTYDGITWNTGYKIYVIVNNGSSCLSTADYTTMLIHELTHGLGIGHIAGTGTANMNPSCCTSIQALDRECLDYTYAPALPVELIDFTAQKKSRSVNINWSTASEMNNDYFLLERSAGGRAFERLAKLPGAGNSQEIQAYNYLDQEPRAGYNYYRLKQVDFDGKYEYSDTRSVYFEINEEEVSVYPNPLDEAFLNVVFSSSSERDLDLELIDVEGKRLFHKKYFLEKGVNRMQLSTGELPSGIYWLRFNYGTNLGLERVVKL
ncbi:MAG TPA: T9SS type A sorting domain-containing protein [Bacteroidetes bacterium]|nr:T9SS type A sorting domain-containing protein [Bacteroidota bacterium]